MSSPYLDRDFFHRHHLDLARDLLGCTLEWDGCAGVVVETEGYGAEGDEATAWITSRSG